MMAPGKGTERVSIYTDGACLGNPGVGGWAALLCCRNRERELSGAETATTNNRMELMAAICALEALHRSCHISLVTDSQYVRQGILTWLATWQARGWRRADGRPVLNQDLWQRLQQAADRHRVDWCWVRGHSGDAKNERVDQLARDAARALAASRDEEMP